MLSQGIWWAGSLSESQVREPENKRVKMQGMSRRANPRNEKGAEMVEA